MWHPNANVNHMQVDFHIEVIGFAVQYEKACDAKNHTTGSSILELEHTRRLVGGRLPLDHTSRKSKQKII